MSRRWITLGAVLSTLCVLGVPATGQVVSPPQRPNIVLIVTDDQRWDSVRGIMPVVESELLARGMDFTNAFVTDPLCCPSRASIMTGLYPHSHGVYGNDNGESGGFQAFDDSSTIATWLDDEGYNTGLVGRYLNGYDLTGGTYVAPGWDEWYVLMTGNYYSFALSDNGQARSFSSSYSTDVLAAEATHFIRNAPTSDPLFLMFTPRAPHGPYTPVSTYDQALEDLPPYRPPSWQEADVRDKPRWVRRIEPAREFRLREYEADRIDSLETLLSVDDAVGLILDELESTGRLENTLIVFTSDNGYLWGEHRIFEGKNVPYDASVRVPMIMRWDGVIPAGSSVSTVAANIDLAPTLASVAGIAPPVPVDGLSLTSLFGGIDGAIRRQGVLVEHGPGAGIPPYCGFRTANDLFVRYTTGEEEYYNYVKDPFELENRAASPSAQRLVDGFRQITRTQCAPPPPNMRWHPSAAGRT